MSTYLIYIAFIDVTVKVLVIYPEINLASANSVEEKKETNLSILIEIDAFLTSFLMQVNN